MTMQIVQVSLDKANTFSNTYSSRYTFVTDCDAAFGIVDGAGDLHGVAICRKLDSNENKEKAIDIVSLCTDDWYNADLLLYKACCRFARDMGCSKVVALAGAERNTALIKQGFVRESESRGLERLRSRRYRNLKVRWIKVL